MIQSAVKFSLARLADDKVWPDGIQLLEYDNQSGPSEAGRQAEGPPSTTGAHIVIQGASSAIAGQITGDVQKHNLRNPGREVLYINVGGQAMELTGTKCHFYHFRCEHLRRRSDACDVLGCEGDRRSWQTRFITSGRTTAGGQDVERITAEYAKQYGYNVVGSVLHDVNKIQDFAPYVAKIKDSGADTVVTGNWGN